MDAVLKAIQEIGSEIKSPHEVVISELSIKGDIATFQAGENDNLFVMEFEQRDTDESIEVDLKNLTILVDFGSENYVPIDVSLNENHLFIVGALEQYIAAELYSQRVKAQEADHWENLIDHFQASKH
ncbi:MAG: hypothetical protein RR285_00135 [Acinetobacter sp.]